VHIQQRASFYVRVYKTVNCEDNIIQALFVERFSIQHRITVGGRKKMHTFRFAALSAICVGLLQGCAEYSSFWLDRYGPDPYLVQTTAETVSQRELAVVQAMIRASGHGETYYPQGRNEWYYNAILVGFNTIDDACSEYMDDLWKLDRRKTRSLGILTATGSAVGAIVGASGNPSASTLAILTQAFGLSSALVTDISGSYLYSKDAGQIKGLVKKLTDAYRTDLVTNANNLSYPIEGPAAAYHHMREYLQLCLPPNIEAQIAGLVANAQAVPDGSSGSNQDATLKKQVVKGGNPAPNGTAKVTSNILAK
jgi:hypothetical protein